MQSSGSRLLLAFGVAIAMASAAGCSMDLYQECRPDPRIECGDNDRCVSDPDFQCESRVCGRLEVGEGFCTKSCDADEDCPNGECEPIVPGGDPYCIPRDQLN